MAHPFAARIGQRIALASIAFYRAHLSRHKGFKCAYAHHTGCASCSALGFRAIRRFGLRQGLSVLRARLDQCALKHKLYSRRVPRYHPQAGFCDLDCGGCDVDFAGAACDGADCCDAPGDCGSRSDAVRAAKERGRRGGARAKRRGDEPPPASGENEA
jgi:putative component of membrane protein insertase Oxa1/YidC/SpoIIIJ protein YidD